MKSVGEKEKNIIINLSWVNQKVCVMFWFFKIESLKIPELLLQE